MLHLDIVLCHILYTVLVFFLLFWTGLAFAYLKWTWTRRFENWASLVTLLILQRLAYDALSFDVAVLIKRDIQGTWNFESVTKLGDKHSTAVEPQQRWSFVEPNVVKVHQGLLSLADSPLAGFLPSSAPPFYPHHHHHHHQYQQIYDHHQQQEHQQQQALNNLKGSEPESGSSPSSEKAERAAAAAAAAAATIIHHSGTALPASAAGTVRAATAFDFLSSMPHKGEFGFDPIKGVSLFRYVHFFLYLLFLSLIYTQSRLEFCFIVILVSFLGTNEEGNKCRPVKKTKIYFKETLKYWSKTEQSNYCSMWY